MSSVNLRYLVESDKDAFFKAFHEEWEASFDFVHYWESVAHEDFQKYIIVAKEFAKGMHIPKEHVPSCILFAFNEEGSIVGRTSIRFELNPHLLKIGGHIGYGVCPSFRRKGYASAILKESLIWVSKNLAHIDRVLVTCDEGNIGSQKTIEKNGGVLENIVKVENAPAKRRYWINI